MSTIKHQPATPLPWRVSADATLTLLDDKNRAAGAGETVGDACYIAHAANAYPRLIAALGALVTDYYNQKRDHCDENFIQSRALLRNLGEGQQ